jgi:transcriptional regulator with XRE-family HTH domain
MSKSIHRPEYRLFCAVLRESREHAGLTQAVLAKRLKRPQTFVSAVERGLVRLDFLQMRDWCVRCRTSVADLANEFEAQLRALKKVRRTRGAARS